MLSNEDQVLKKSCDTVQQKQDIDGPMSICITYKIQAFVLLMCPSINIFLTFSTNATANLKMHCSSVVI